MTTFERLERLASVTDYGQLRDAFESMKREAQHAGNAVEVAAAIDEAIRRVEEERIRDEDELEDFRSQFDSFKEQHAGVVGWFKRKIPFSQTRRLDSEHAHRISDQESEILADNLVIARAQLLKERLLSEEQRFTGHTDASWQDRIAKAESPYDLQPLADVASHLNQKLGQSQQFLDEIRDDIAAFGKADFSGKEDHRHRKSDFKDANAKLREFEDEIKSKSSLLKDSVHRLGELLHRHSESNDSEFRTSSLRLKSLTQALKDNDELKEDFESLESMAKDWAEAASNVSLLPAQIETHQRESTRLNSELAESVRHEAKLESQNSRVVQRFDHAKLRRDQAVSAERAAESLLNAYFEENCESVGDQKTSLELEYEQTKRELDEAKGAFEAANGPYQALTGELDALKQKTQRNRDEVAATEKTLVESESQLADLDRRLPERRDKITSECERCPNDLAGISATSMNFDSKAA